MGPLGMRARKTLIYFSPALALVPVLLLASLQLPLVNTTWREMLGVSGEIQIGLWPSLTPTPSPTLTFTPTPTTTPTPTPQPACVLRGSLSITRFFEHGRFGIDIQLCLTNAGQTRIENLQALNVIEVSRGADPFVDYLSQSLDLSARPDLDPGEGYCYTARIFFDPVPGGKYRSHIRVTVADPHAGQMSAMGLVEPSAAPAVLELETDFSLPDAPTATATLTLTATNTPAPTLSLTPVPTSTLEGSTTPTETSFPTSTLIPPTPTAPGDPTSTLIPPTEAPILDDPTSTAPEATATPVPTETLTPLPSETPTPVPLPSDTLTPVPTDTPTAAASSPTDTP
jgi:hypothetical protein